jgi:hypothetical protein
MDKKVKMQTTSAQWPDCFCKKMCRSNTCKKLLCRKSIRTQIFSDSVEAYFLHEVLFSAAIEAAHFPDPQIDALQQSREGAPFMGTALAAYKQSH